MCGPTKREQARRSSTYCRSTVTGVGPPRSCCPPCCSSCCRSPCCPPSLLSIVVLSFGFLSLPTSSLTPRVVLCVRVRSVPRVVLCDGIRAAPRLVPGGILSVSLLGYPAHRPSSPVLSSVFVSALPLSFRMTRLARCGGVDVCFTPPRLFFCVSVVVRCPPFVCCSLNLPPRSRFSCFVSSDVFCFPRCEAPALCVPGCSVPFVLCGWYRVGVACWLQTETKTKKMGGGLSFLLRSEGARGVRQNLGPTGRNCPTD